MKIAVYTAIFGSYNPLRTVPNQTMDADYICFSDNAEMKCEGWKTIVTKYPRQDFHPRLRAKYFKVLPHYIEELQQYDVLIYIDGSIEIRDKDFIKWCIENLGGNDMCLFKHPQRDCIFEEFVASDECRKYDHEDKVEQRRDYRMKYPEHGGLYACGVCVLRITPCTIRVMNDWWHEILKYTIQDQVSFPVVCKANNFIPATFEENQYSNKYFQVNWHDDVPATVKVSVLMPVYNTKAEHFENAVNSVLQQTFQDFELIVVDDGSTNQDTIDYLLKISSNQRIKIVNLEENSGIVTALNSGINHCNGDLIARMDSDDIARPKWLATMVDFMRKHPGIIIAGCQIQPFGIYTERTNHYAMIDKTYVLRTNSNWFFNHPGCIYRKEPIVQLGSYGNPPREMLAEDYALWCRLLKAGYYLYNIPDCLIDYRVERLREPTGERKLFLQQCRESLHTKYSDKITYHMATMYSRRDILKDCVNSILPQCDELHIYLNGYPKEVPQFLNQAKIKLHHPDDCAGDIGDVGKFWDLESWTGYNFTVDDKIIYPPDYTERTIEKIEQYNRKAIVSYHGRIMHLDRYAVSYYKDFQMVIDFQKHLSSDTQIHIPGTGVQAFHASAMATGLEIFEYINMSDIFIAKHCNENNIPVMALTHPRGWIKVHPKHNPTHSILYAFKDNDIVQTQIVNSIKWKKV